MEQLWNDMRTTVYETMGIEQTAVPVNPEEDEADSKVQSLSQELDVDALNEDFKKFAGMDDMLSRVEYDTFIKTRKIPPAIAGVLWSLLDTDGSGEVSKDEFKSALIALQSSRSWSRYCPACEYRNDCAFCQECNSGCPRCSDVSFCASCWNDHPGRQLTMEEQALHPLRLLHPLHPLLPLHICICIYIYILHLHLTSTSMPAAPTAPSTPSTPTALAPPTVSAPPAPPAPSSTPLHRSRTIRTANRTPLARPSTCERPSSSDLLSGRTTRER